MEMIAGCGANAADSLRRYQVSGMFVPMDDSMARTSLAGHASLSAAKSYRFASEEVYSVCT